MVVVRLQAYAGVFNRAGAMAAGGGMLGVVVAIAGIAMAGAAGPVGHDLRLVALGDQGEVCKSGLFDAQGVFLGRLGSLSP